MAMSIGTATGGGMAKAIYDALVAEFGAPEPDAEPVWKNLSKAMATGVVNHIKANADVIVTTSDGGLQRDPDTSTDTLAPASNKTLSGAVD